ncbi:hypothetical protein DID88_004627 [Monilinia fructigena]|uniref:T-complex protein 1 subunit delta n=1 Tax=Monilinia fructigena TaxID=38457 RepID=A0A395IR31_9HELO|nr:hypothetical protein DID88_004627 [Monilinia fructigena]
MLTDPEYIESTIPGADRHVAGEIIAHKEIQKIVVNIANVVFRTRRSLRLFEMPTFWLPERNGQDDSRRQRRTLITNDGSTMMKSMAVMHPSAKMLVDLSAAQDVEAGDGTTSVVVICGSLLGAADKLLGKGIHPSVIAESFQRAAAAAVQVLHDMSVPVALSDTATLLQAATLRFLPKSFHNIQIFFGPMAVNAVTKTIDIKTADNVDLKNIRIVKKGGCLKNGGGPIRMEKAKIGLIQFQLSPPKPDMENQIVIQKSILRDAVNELSLHFLAKLNILCIKDIERDEVEFICKSTGCKPIADIDSFTEDKLGSADLVEEAQTSGSRLVKITGTKSAGKTVSIVCRGANSLILDEAERSLHDALCVVRCLVKKKALIAGGGAPEIEIASQLAQQARELTGTEAICWKAFADAMEVIPTTLAENAGLNSIKVVTETAPQACMQRREERRCQYQERRCQGRYRG